MKKRKPAEARISERGFGWIVPVVALPCVVVLVSTLPAEAVVMFGPEETVTAGGVAIDVPGYSVPSFVDWDNDGRNDLVVGEGSGTVPAKVRVYSNIGTATAPRFSSAFSYAQSGGSDLQLTGSGCMGLFPRVVYWDADGRKDLLVGDSNGHFRLYLNTNTDEDPQFDGGTLLEVGDPGSKVTIDVGSRATPGVVDWNNDGRKDVVAGAYDGRIHLFLNEGTDVAPDFRGETFVQEGSGNLDVPSNRSSPVVLDLDGDGKKDILTGNTNGQLLFYSNTGTDVTPSFSGYSAAESNGVPIDLAGTPRSRPFVCDWTGDGLLDVLIGSLDGMVRLYQAPIPGDTNNDHTVDDLDAQTLAGYWGQTIGGGYTVGDFDGDGVVGPADASIMAANWGHGTGEARPVPEPSMLVTSILAGLGFLIYAGRRGRGVAKSS